MWNGWSGRGAGGGDSDLVRIGAGLVGIDEAGAVGTALTLRTRVLQVRWVVTGDGVWL